MTVSTPTGSKPKSATCFYPGRRMCLICKEGRRFQGAGVVCYVKVWEQALTPQIGFRLTVLCLSAPADNEGPERGRRTPGGAAGRKISPAAVALIEAHAVEEYPFEACGAVVTHVPSGAELLLRLANSIRDVDSERARERFEVEPLALLELLRGEERGLIRVECFYHSHPDGLPEPSEEDGDVLAPGGVPSYPGVLHAICAVNGRGEAETRVFVLGEGPWLEVGREEKR